MSPISIRHTLEWLLSADTVWRAHPECLARVMGWSEEKLTRETAPWRLLSMTRTETATVGHRLKLIMSGEIAPTLIKRTIPGDWNAKGRYGDRDVFEWLPARVLTPKPLTMPNRMGVQVAGRGPRVLVNVQR